MASEPRRFPADLIQQAQEARRESGIAVEEAYALSRQIAALPGYA